MQMVKTAATAITSMYVSENRVRPTTAVYIASLLIKTFWPAGPPRAINAAKSPMDVPTGVYPLVTNSASPAAGSPSRTITVAAASPGLRFPVPARMMASPTQIA